MRPGFLSFLTVLLVCVLPYGVMAAFDDALHVESSETGQGKFEVDARGKFNLPVEFIRQVAMLRAAEATLESGAQAFRIVRGQKRTIKRRHPPYTKSFAIFLDIETNRSGNQPSPEHKWLDARRVVSLLSSKVKKQAKELGIWKD